MGGNHGRADPYSKVKFTIPSFDGSYDGDAYLDWEMIVEQKFNTHMVSENHRVRLATCEFVGYVILWWNELVNSGLEPDTWERLKRAMRGRFLPTIFKRDLKKKLQRLNQGNNSVNDYYQELQITMLRCDVQEHDEDKMIRFHSGLRWEIQDIVDYKDYNTTNRLLHLALLVEKELQGCQQVARNNFGANSATRSTSGQAKTAPSSACTRPPAPSSSPRVPEVSKSPVLQAPAKSTSSSTSTRRTTPIVCHHCKVMGHVMKDCPCQRAYIATDDGGYVSASDVEDEVALVTNLAAQDDEITDEMGDEVLGTATTASYKTIIVQRVLSTQIKQEERLQCHNLFQMFLIVQDYRIRVIIDGGSCNNLVSSDLIKKLGLTT